MNKLRLGFAMCGSFCTIDKALRELEQLADMGYEITPILSPIVYTADTRFTKAKELISKVEAITGRAVIKTVEEAEPIGPKSLFDILAVCPCTGNTMAKLAAGITDTSVTMAVKAHLRNNRPVVLAPATNDALGAAAKNIGHLLNVKNIYFVPFAQDDPVGKERSMIADFSLLEDTIVAAMSGRQLCPIVK